LNEFEQRDWIDRASRLVMQLGLPTVFAAVLLWFVLWKLDGTLTALTVETRSQTQTLDAILQHVVDREQRERDR
jgi:hypothetical protein